MADLTNDVRLALAEKAQRRIHSIYYKPQEEKMDELAKAMEEVLYRNTLVETYVSDVNQFEEVYFEDEDLTILTHNEFILEEVLSD